MLTVSPHEKLRRSGARFGVFPILDELKRQDMKENEIILTTKPFECGWVNLAQPDKLSTKFEVEMIFSADDTALTEITEAVAKAGSGVGHNPVKPHEVRQGMYSIKAKSKFEVRIVGVDNSKIDKSSLRKGDTARANIKIAPYDHGDNKGVTIYLLSVQKIADGDGHDDFGPLPDQPPAQQGEDLAW